MVCHALQQSGNSSVVKAERSGGCHYAYTGAVQLAQFVAQCGGATRMTQAVAPERGILFDQYNVAPGKRCSERSRPSCRPTPDN